MTWKKGESGNPGGRPKANLEVIELARSYCTAAIKRLAYLSTKAKSESAQVAACTALLDRGFGKPPQALKVGGDGNSPLIARIERVIVEPTTPTSIGGSN